MIRLLLLAVSGLLMIGCATSREKQLQAANARLAAAGLELYKIQQARAQAAVGQATQSQSTSAAPLGSFANPIYIAPTPIQLVPMTQPTPTP
jgi:hypothetical protein